MNKKNKPSTKNNFVIPHKDYIDANFTGFVKNVVLNENGYKFDCLAKSVEKYAKNVNITAIKDYDSIWLKHILDSLMILNIDEVYEYFAYEEFKGLDIGTGGGFPGLALAVARDVILENKSGAFDRFKTAMTLGAGVDFYDADTGNEVDLSPELSEMVEGEKVGKGVREWKKSFKSGGVAYLNGFLLVDSTKKKVDVVNKVIEECDVGGATALWSRVEDLDDSYHKKFGLITARAVAPLSTLIKWASPLLSDFGLMAFYKTDNKDELENSTKEIKNANLFLLKEFKYSLADTNRVIWVFARKN